MFHTGSDLDQNPRKDVLAKQLLRAAREYYNQLIEIKYDHKKTKRQKLRKNLMFSVSGDYFINYCDKLVSELWSVDKLKADDEMTVSVLSNHMAGLMQYKALKDEHEML